MTNRESLAVVEFLTDAFPKTNLTDRQINVFARMIADFDYEPTMRAAERLARTTRFMPTIAELRKAATPPRESDGMILDDYA